MNNMGDFLNAVRGIYAASDKLASKVDEGYGYKSPEIYKLVEELYIEVGDMLDFLEENDENMEVGALGSVDEYFEDSPVSDYVDAVINLASGKGTIEDVQKAIDNIKEKETTKAPESVGEFAGRVVESLDFPEDEEEYKKAFQKNLERAIETLQTCNGRAEFYVDVNGDTLEGRMASEGKTVSIIINGEQFILNYGLDIEEDEEDCTGEEATCTNPDCCMADQEYDEDEEEEDYEDDLYDYVVSVDEDYYKVVNEVMKEIEDSLAHVTEFTGKDIELIRYYLKHVPFNNEDIDSLSDKAVILAFKRRINNKI